MTYHITKPKPAPVSPRILPANEPQRPKMTMAEYAAIENKRRIERDGGGGFVVQTHEARARYEGLMERLNAYMAEKREAKSKQIRADLELSQYSFDNLMRHARTNSGAKFAYQNAGQVYVWKGEQ